MIGNGHVLFDLDIFIQQHCIYSTITLIGSLTLKVSVYERDSAHELLSLSLLLYLLRNVQSLPAETPAGHGKLGPHFCLFVCMHLSLVMSVCVGFVVCKS